MAKDAQVVQMRTKKQTPKGVVKGIRELSLKDLNRTPLADYYQMAGRFVNVESYVYYATALYAAGSAIKIGHKVDLFTKGYSEELKIPNNGHEIDVQGKALTNMITGGEFDDSTSFLLEMIAVELFLTSEPVTTWTDGVIVNPAHSPVSTYSAPNHYHAITRQFEIDFIRGEKQSMVDGLLFEFPSPFVASGAFGASSGGFIQNGFAVPTWNKLSEIHALKSQERFRVEVRPVADGFTPQVNFGIKVMFIGKRISKLYA